jgi:hypothetical protein
VHALWSSRSRNPDIQRSVVPWFGVPHLQAAKDAPSFFWFVFCFSCVVIYRGWKAHLQSLSVEISKYRTPVSARVVVTAVCVPCTKCHYTMFFAPSLFCRRLECVLKNLSLCWSLFWVIESLRGMYSCLMF